MLSSISSRSSRSLALVVASAAAAISVAADAAVTMQIICDNHFAMYVGTANGITRKLFENTGNWTTQLANAASFDIELQGAETHFYLLGMGGGGQENIGGRVNGVALDTIAVTMSSNIAGSLAGYTNGLQTISGVQRIIPVENGQYVSQLADVQAGLATATWGAVSIQTSGVGAGPTGKAFGFSSLSARLFRFEADAVGVTAVPAPGALALIGVAGLVGGRRRRS
jgi:MYXO-CTERM domain-containing protein